MKRYASSKVVFIELDDIYQPLLSGAIAGSTSCEAGSPGYLKRLANFAQVAPNKIIVACQVYGAATHEKEDVDMGGDGVLVEKV